MTEWQELVIEGPQVVMRAFVLGFIAGRDAGGGVFGSDAGLEAPSLGERLKALFAAASAHVFLAPAHVAVPLAQALRARGGDVGLRLHHTRSVRAARFGFRAEVFSRDAATTIRDALIVSLPAGVHVEDLSQKEETHPDARGPEPFAPLHSYIFRVSGRIAGAFEGVLEAWQRARALDFVEAESLQLDTGQYPA